MKNLFFSVIFLVLFLFLDAMPITGDSNKLLYVDKLTTNDTRVTFLPTIKEKALLVERRLRTGIIVGDFTLIGGKVKLTKVMALSSPVLPIENRTSRSMNPEQPWEPG